MDGISSGAAVAANGAPLIADPAAIMQAAFQPSATPEDHKRRYLCWNANGNNPPPGTTFTHRDRFELIVFSHINTGVILSLKGDTFTSYEIDFTDTSMGRQQRYATRHI